MVKVTNSAELYPVKWTDIPPGALVEALVGGKPVLYVRWLSAGLSGVACLPSPTAGPVFPLHATNKRQGPVRVVADGLTDEDCTAVSRLAGRQAIACARLLRAARTRGGTNVWLKDAEVGTAAVHTSVDSWGGALFVKFADQIRYVKFNVSAPWAGIGEILGCPVLTGLTPAQCERLATAQYEDLPDLLIKIEAEFAEAAKPTPYKIGDAVRWSDLRPGSVFRHADGDEYLRVRTPDADGDDVVALDSDDDGCFRYRPDAHADVVFTAIAVDLDAATCDALVREAGDVEAKFCRWQLMLGAYRPIRELAPGRFATRSDGTWVGRLTGGRLRMEGNVTDPDSASFVSETDLVDPFEAELTDEQLLIILESPDPERAYFNLICGEHGRPDCTLDAAGRRAVMHRFGDAARTWTVDRPDCTLDAAGRRAVMHRFGDAARTWTVDPLSYREVQRLALAAVRAFVEDEDASRLRRFGVFATKRDGGWLGWWGTAPRRARTPEELLITYYLDWPSERQALAAVLGCDPENLGGSTHGCLVSLGKLLATDDRRAQVQTSCLHRDDDVVALVASPGSGVVSGPTLVALQERTAETVIVWDFAGRAGKTKLQIATRLRQLAGPNVFEMIYLDMAPKPCEDGA